MNKLNPGVALIPGGTRGIGRSIALSLAEDGWGVALAYQGDEISADKTRHDLEALDAHFSLCRTNLESAENARAFVAEALCRWGKIDALINTLGVFQRQPLLEETPESWRKVWASNVDAVFYLCQAAATPMKQHGKGRIINFGVVNAESAPFTVGAHHLAKAAVANLSRCLAQGLAPDGITVNTLRLGFFEDGVTLPTAPIIPARRLGRHEEVVGAVRYLLSEDAAYVNGAEIAISGGWGL
ncbi:MAG: SDR family oxidoreductase [Deltaproteobacteria bacterium]|nr:SDR family oxidoreductase [Deltaproteobacteria bacterium]